MSVVRNEFEEALLGLCEYKEEFDKIFRRIIRESEFKVSRYKDQKSYDACIKHKKMYNKLKYVLYLCSSLDESE